MRRMASLGAFAGAFLVWVTALLYAQGPPEISFEEDVLPIFQEAFPPEKRGHCTACHSGPAPQAGLDLNSLEGVLAGSERGPVVIPGDGENSPIVLAVEGRLVRKGVPVPRMPFDGPPFLDEETIGIIRAWIDQLEAEEIVEIRSTFAVTQAVVRRGRKPGQDAFQLSGVYQDGGADRGLPDLLGSPETEVSLMLSTPTQGTLWSKTILAGSFAPKGTKFVFQDKAEGLSISFDTKKKGFAVSAQRQSLSGLADPAQFVISVGGLAGSQLIPTSVPYVGGRSTPLSAVFYVTRGTIRPGKKVGTDQFAFEGVLSSESGLPNAPVVDVRVELGPFAEIIRVARQGTRYAYVAPRGTTGLARFTIDAKTGKFSVSAVGLDLPDLTGPAILRLQVGDVAGRATLVLSGSAATGFRYP
ncbi:MAG: hypothetical protein HYY20_00015 [Candidatus Tectomicrobia bacterium]|uniref:Cytochrome C Planctomycete-type domain-containing protein n=1 Tax=Tectimicrobiota bacterium TaxID=2528274 RepID=A0A932FX86_UNCTE|nr:hypothetical protein [Candidatus Tectomicrobia bacterium]